jgi:NAD(P)-dependent dehydrogenase (short-subunit alcohol dehydrogenase family)
MPTVLVTGASRGIGRATALRLASSGWDVLAGVRSPADGEALRAEGGDRLRPIQLDITSAVDVAALPGLVAAGLDAVVNNAGAALDGPVEGLDLQAIRALFELNVFGHIAVTQAVLPALRASRGRIVFISSLNGRISTPMAGAYSATKFAIEAFADALRIELRPWRIGVALIEPGPVATDIWHDALERFDSARDHFAPQHQQLYRTHFTATRRMMTLLRKRAVPVDQVTKVIDQALTTRSPRARYQVNISGRAQLFSRVLTPTRIFDAAVAAVAGARRRSGRRSD